MNIIKISTFSNEAASKAKGEVLKSLIEQLLCSSNEITIDFSNINRFASPFFNNSFASLALSHGFDAIKNIHLINISETGLNTYKTSIDNAKSISQSPEYTSKIDQIINNTPKKAE